MEKVIIVGSGCAGLTAAIYAARANLSPLVLEGRQPGGQLSTTTLVENYPGFPDGIDGPQLIMNMHKQAEKFGTRFSYAEVTDFELRNKHVRIKADDEWLETQAFIIASGASARYLRLENEEKLIGHGLTSCATCDGAFYKNVPVCVIGGGDSAAEESLFLTRFASKVYLIHRRDKMRASVIMQERVFANKKIEPIWNTVVTKYIPDEKGEMRAVRLRNVETNEERELDVACVFVAIGHDPNTKAYRGKLDMDADGYLIAKNLVESKYPGVFIAGDENAGIFALHQIFRNQISVRIHVEFASIRFRIGIMADRHKHARHVQFPFLVCLHIAETHGAHLAFFIGNVFCHHSVPDRLDLLVREYAFLHDYGRAHFVATMNQIDL